jgi:hypothetical protein
MDVTLSEWNKMRFKFFQEPLTAIEINPLIGYHLPEEVIQRLHPETR